LAGIGAIFVSLKLCEIYFRNKGNLQELKKGILTHFDKEKTAPLGFAFGEGLYIQ
jgi:hypothetical protein